ncbi:hypothetical protein A0J61_02053 [Choanephora cucurbitarum]|uniref:K Homology domain-containing protein n=1 Tax=Choanephora cucurbitarum TaxID=101091 RepID=A0A1C7NL59_9FUNG|nr:hypothetical protein A0J61_02053 [Choanephora cucurbitarum]
MSSTNADKLISAVTAASRHHNNVHMRAILPRFQAVAILGRKGLSIQYLQNYYQVQMRLSEIKTTRKWGRLIHICGQSKQMAEVWRSCLEPILREEEDHTGKIGVNFVLPESMIELLLYHPEDSFASITRQTNTEITIKSSVLPRSTERLVFICVPGKDQVDEFSKAVSLLSHYLEKYARYALSFPNTKFYVQEADDFDSLEQAVLRQSPNDVILQGGCRVK